VLRTHFASATSAILLAGGLALGLASASPAAAAAIRPAHSTAGLSVAARAARAVRVLPLSTSRAVPRTSIPNGTCYVWTDGITFGTECTNVSGLPYEATAGCQSGNVAYGPSETSGWSYAYCSTYGSTIENATVAIAGINGGPLKLGNRPLSPTIAPARVMRRSLAVSRTHHSQQAHRLKPTTASSASEDGLCSVWTDGTTFGTACSWTYGPAIFEAYAAVAACTNNISAAGPVVYDGWSYAYCSTYNQQAVGGGIAF
jgi:hypothetical protein